MRRSSTAAVLPEPSAPVISTATWRTSKRNCNEAEGTPIVVTDGVFSMEGSLAKLPEIVALAERYGAVTVVDDSHGTGVMGPPDEARSNTSVSKDGSTF